MDVRKYFVIFNIPIEHLSKTTSLPEIKTLSFNCELTY